MPPGGGTTSVSALLGGFGGGVSSLDTSLVERDLCKSSMKGLFPEFCMVVEGLLGGLGRDSGSGNFCISSFG